MQGDFMQFIYYPKCSTCIKAKKKLEELKIEADLRDIKENNPNKEELISFYFANLTYLLIKFIISNIILKHFFCNKFALAFILRFAREIITIYFQPITQHFTCFPDI